MYGCVICLAAAALGIDVGWQRLPEGGVQYLIQIGPETLETLKAGVPIESDIPPTVKDIRGYRISVGNKPLPRDSVASESKPSTGASDLGFSRPTTGSPVAGGPPSATPWPSSPSPTPFTPMPHTLAPDPSGKPLAEQAASYVQPVAPGPMKTESKPEASPAAEPQSSGRLWTYLTGSLVALSGSLAWNGYLLWMLREARRRYRALLDRTGASDEEADEEEEEEEE